MDEIVRRLADENEIKKLIMQLSFAMDLRDRDMYRSVFADEIECDITAIVGEAVPLTGAMNADEFADNIIEMLSEFEMTQHVNAMHMIEVHGDDATLSCYVIGTHYLGRPTTDPSGHCSDPWNTIGARYDMRARRFTEGWLFVAFKWRMMWSRDNHDLWNEVGQRLTARRGLGSQ
jgi:hypothetical protein